MTKRDDVRKQFLAKHRLGEASVTLLAGDASFRSYYRVAVGQNETLVLMDAPPDREGMRPFLRCQECLLGLGFSAPKLIEADLKLGFLLLEDFGDQSYTAILAKASPQEEATLYRLAVDTLVALHRTFRESDHTDFPHYDDEKLLEEAALLVGWYLPEVIDVSALTAHNDWRTLWSEVLPGARDVPESLVLRDLHADNLMWLPGRKGVAACGQLDFQDAVIGPVTYDLVSLLSDARRDLPLALERELRAAYLDSFPKLNIDVDAFDRSYAILGAQRSAKIIGIFTRLDQRDGKPGYLEHIPRVWRQLEAHLEHPVLEPVRDWLDDAIPPGRRVQPAPRK